MGGWEPRSEHPLHRSVPTISSESLERTQNSGPQVRNLDQDSEGNPDPQVHGIWLSGKPNTIGNNRHSPLVFCKGRFSEGHLRGMESQDPRM